jgi:hypothetical protein
LRYNEVIKRLRCAGIAVRRWWEGGFGVSTHESSYVCEGNGIGFVSELFCSLCECAFGGAKEELKATDPVCGCCEDDEEADY